MKIYSNYNLFISPAYLYDISKCHMTILDKLGYDISELKELPKLERNIAIGKLMKTDERLSKILISLTNSIMDEFIRRSNLKNHVLIRQYDGIITNKRACVSDPQIELSLTILNKLLISIDRRMFLAQTRNGNFLVKGVPNCYDNIKPILSEIISLQFTSLSSIFIGMDNIRNKILNGSDINLYIIPKDNNTSRLYIRDTGWIELSRNLIEHIDVNEIDREYYYNVYIRPFFESILLEFMGK